MFLGPSQQRSPERNDTNEPPQKKVQMETFRQRSLTKMKINHQFYDKLLQNILYKPIGKNLIDKYHGLPQQI